MRRLDQFLQASLRIVAFLRSFEPCGERSVPDQHEALRRGQVAVQVKRANQRLEGILQDRGALASTGLLLALVQAHARVEPEVEGHLREETALGEHRAAAAEDALP